MNVASVKLKVFDCDAVPSVAVTVQ